MWRCGRIAFVGDWRYYTWMGVLTVFCLLGLNAYAKQFVHGLIVTGMSDEVSWGVYIANFTFLVGVAAAAVMMVIPVYIYNNEELHDLVIFGELLAVAAILMCLAFVTVDLGRPDRFWHLAVARRIADDGLVRGIALFPDNGWGQRVREAFLQELQAAGTVTLMSAQYYEASAKDYSGPLRAALGRYGGAGDRSAKAGQAPPPRNAAAEQATGPQFAFVAATPQAARAIAPQLRFQMTYGLPLYTTSDAWDPSVRAAADMDGMIFPEMPWLLYGGQGAPELWDAVQEEWSARARGRLRLYAFGYDAFRVVQQFGSAGAMAAGVDGLTGLLEVNRNDGRVQRSLQFARIEAGKPLAAGPSVPIYREVLPANATGVPPAN